MIYFIWTSVSIPWDFSLITRRSLGNLSFATTEEKKSGNPLQQESIRHKHDDIKKKKKHNRKTHFVALCTKLHIRKKSRKATLRRLVFSRLRAQTTKFKDAHVQYKADKARNV